MHGWWIRCKQICFTSLKTIALDKISQRFMNEISSISWSFTIIVITSISLSVPADLWIEADEGKNHIIYASERLNSLTIQWHLGAIYHLPGPTADAHESIMSNLTIFSLRFELARTTIFLAACIFVFTCGSHISPIAKPLNISSIVRKWERERKRKRQQRRRKIHTVIVSVFLL